MSRARRSSRRRAHTSRRSRPHTHYAFCTHHAARAHTHTHTALARRPVRAPCSRSDCRSVGPPTPTPHPRVRIMPAQGLASRVDRRIARSAFVDDDDDDDDDVVVSRRVVTRDRYGAFKGTFRTRAYARVCTPRDVAHGCIRARERAPFRGCGRRRVGGIRACACVRACVRACVYACVRRD